MNSQLNEILDNIQYSRDSVRFVYDDILDVAATQPKQYVSGYIHGLVAMGDLYNDSYYGVDELLDFIESNPDWYAELREYAVAR